MENEITKTLIGRKLYTTPKAKRDRFERVATSRTNNIIKCLNTLGHCANRSAYEYSEQDINRIFSAIQEKIAETRGKFHTRYKDKERFTLDAPATAKKQKV